MYWNCIIIGHIVAKSPLFKMKTALFIAWNVFEMSSAEQLYHEK